MADKSSIIIVIVLILLGLIYFSGNFVSGNAGANPSGAGDFKDSSVDIFLADKDYNPVDVKKDAGTFSVVQLPGYQQASGIYFMRLNVKVTNDGSLTKQVKITNIDIQDADGSVIESDTIRAAFRCILNKPVNLNATKSYTWSTDPKDTATGCSGLAWIPTSIFERYAQPLKIVATVNVKFTIFGVLKESTSTIPAQIAIGNDTGGFGSISGEIIGGGTTSFLKECNAGETQVCPFGDVVGSVCYGKIQTCFIPSGGTIPSAEGGLWSGCSSDTYGADFVSNAESNGNFLVTCKDGKDNDCDGTYDKPLANMTCPRGTCDYDCPACVVQFRTNAQVDSSPSCITGSKCPGVPYVSGTWISIQKLSTDDFLTSYGYVSTTSYSSSSCPNYVKGLESPAGYSFAGFTSKQNYAILKNTVTGNSLRIYYEDDDTANNCKYISYSSGSSDRCKYGDTYYPSCILRFPVNVFNLAKQENCVDY